MERQMKRRILSLFLVIIMLLSMIGQGKIYLAEEIDNTETSSSVKILDYNAQEGDIKDVIEVSPLAEQIYSKETIDEMVAALEEQETENIKDQQDTSNVDLSSTVYTNWEDAVEHIREQMVAHEEVVEITIDLEALGKEDSYVTYLLLWDAAVAYSDECTGQEGDSLEWGWDYRRMSGSDNGDSTTIRYTITWRTTAEQEAELTTAVDAALEGLALDGKTDYQKARAIYDYICDTVNYDYEHYYGDEEYPLMYTSYAAMCHGTSVCQGYALLYYRMCKDAGLSSRHITGYANGESHAWNIVRIGDVYYNADTTWDGSEEESYHHYFLQNMTDFGAHTREDEYETAEFHEEFPMAVDSWSDYSDLVGPSENLDVVTFTTVDGGTVTNQAEGKPKLLIFATIYSAFIDSTISKLSLAQWDDIDIVFLDAYNNSLESVTEFRDMYGSAIDGIQYAYNESYSTNIIYNTKIEYEEKYLEEGTITCPTLVYINENNIIKFFESGRTYSAEHIRECVNCYLGEREVVEISDKILSMKQGDTKTPQVRIKGILINNQFLTWSSSNTSVATVDGTGKITAKAAGTATITCKANDGVYVTCQVTVKLNGLLSTPVLTSVSNQTTGVKVIWNAVEGAEKYKVFRKTSSTSWIVVGETTSNSCIDTTAESGTTYTYTVRCVSSDGKTFTSAYDATGKSLYYIAAPVISKMQGYEKGINIQWNAVTGAEKYRVFRKTATSGWKAVKNTTSTSFTDTAVEEGITYIYTVRCINSAGAFTSAYDTTGKGITYTAAPTVSNVSLHASGVKVAWGSVSGAEKYRVFRKNATGNWTSVGETTSTSFIDTKAVSGTTYSYTVRCISSDGKSYTGAFDITGKSINYIAAPVISKVEGYAKGINVKWNAVAGAEKYRVFRKTATTGWVVVKTTTATSFTDTTVEEGTTYIYTVRCMNSSGAFTSAYDTVGKSITYAAMPELSSATAATNGVKITWNAAEGAEKYCVFRKTASGSWTIVGYTTGNSFTDTTAVSGTTYTYTVRCVSSDGKSFTSAYNATGISIKY